MKPLGQMIGWVTVSVLVLPVLHTAWISFSPDSFLTPPTRDWSLRWYRAFLDDRRWLAAVSRSLVIATLAGGLSVGVALPAVWAMPEQRTRRQRLMSLAILLPVCLPPVALGMGILPLLHTIGFWGRVESLVVVHAVLGLPIAFLILRTHLTPQLRELHTVARGLGASRVQAFRRVSGPLLAPALIVAALAVAVLSLNESLVTIFLATPRSETVPAVTWPQLRYSPTPLVAVASCMTTLLGIGGILLILRRPWPTRSA